MEWSVYDGPEGNGTLENRLVYWLTLDKWAIDEAAKIISNIVPDQSSINANEGFSNITFFGGKQIPQLDEEGFPETCSECRYVEGCECWELDKTELLKFTRTVDDIKRLLARSFGEDGYVSPKDAVVFITSKKLKVNWLDYAIRVGLLAIEPYKETKQKLAKTSPNVEGTWQDEARKIADEFFDADTRINCRRTLLAYAELVMNRMQEREIHGPRGRITNSNTVMREALSGDKWWRKKSK